MNTYNHHRIIRKFIHDNKDKYLPSNIYDVFEKASDFADDINTESKYFFYHFYYDIKRNDNTIELCRVDEKSSHEADSMKQCDTLHLSHWTNEKEFFSSINERPKSDQLDIYDMGNQSDNVAFLHAMGSMVCKAGNVVVREKPSRSLEIFTDHLKRCFAEYLFVDDDDKALFMLGIAMHGIMDSFTPSHMNFQHYTNQDMGLHAQGDVIPIKCEEKKFDGKKYYLYADEPVRFMPGQYDKAGFGEKRLAETIKKYNSDEKINAIEFEMLRIFINISKLELNGYPADTDTLLTSLQNKKLSEINDILSHYKYGEDAYIYGESAIKAMTEVYDYLADKKKNIQKNYTRYKKIEDKTKKDILEEAIIKWKEIYEEENMKKIRAEHLSHDFYSKKKGKVVKIRQVASRYGGPYAGN